MNLSKLPLRHTDYAGRITLLQQSRLFSGNVRAGFHLSGSNSLLELALAVNEPIENLIGFMPVPLGLATNFRVNGKDILLPLATEESGVVSGCSKAAGLCWPEGFDVTGNVRSTMLGQILFAEFKTCEHSHAALTQLQEGARRIAHETVNSLMSHERSDLLSVVTNRMKNGQTEIVVNLLWDTGESMGAGRVTKLTEKIGHQLGKLTGEHPTACICSNTNAGWRTLARARWQLNRIGGADTARKILAMQRWAVEDPNRRYTHVKGILNAMEGVALATGQDTRALSTAAVAHSAGNSPLTSYEIADTYLVGTLAVNIPVGIRGGATENPFAKMCFELMRTESAQELAQAIGAAGLAANFAALYCLVNEGISTGHERIKPR